MAQVVPDVSELTVLSAWLTAAYPWTLRLYGNNVTPGASSVAGDFTEISGGGYVSSLVDPEGWVLTGDAPSIMVYGSIPMLFGGAPTPSTVYGYFITDANGVLVSAKRFTTGPWSPGVTDVILVIPACTLASLTAD